MALIKESAARQRAVLLSNSVPQRQTKGSRLAVNFVLLIAIDALKKIVAAVSPSITSRDCNSMRAHKMWTVFGSLVQLAFACNQPGRETVSEVSGAGGQRTGATLTQMDRAAPTMMRFKSLAYQMQFTSDGDEAIALR